MLYLYLSIWKETHLKRHLGFVVRWQIPAEEDGCFHHSFDAKV